jgi:hypothetical protein
MSNINISKKRLDKEKVFVVIAPWKYRWFHHSMIKAKIPKDCGYLHYSYSMDILNDDPYITKQNFLEILDIIHDDMNHLNKLKERNFYMYGHSMAGTFVMILADLMPVKAVAAIVPGSNLAECFWNGASTQLLKQDMEQRGMTLPKLKDLWAEISPDSYFKKKSINTKFYLRLSSKDVVIPYENGIKLVKLMKKNKIKFELDENTLTHSHNCGYDYMFPAKTIKKLLNC